MNPDANALCLLLAMLADLACKGGGSGQTMPGTRHTRLAGKSRPKSRRRGIKLNPIHFKPHHT